MQLSNATLEQSVLALLCFSPEHASIVALRVHNANIFSNQTNLKLAEIALTYIQKYNTAPGGQLVHILENDLVRGEVGKLLSQEIPLLQKRIGEINNPDFIIEQLDRFIETQQLQKSLEDSMQLLDQGDLVAARETLYKQVSIPTKGSPGILLNDPRQALSFLNRDEEADFFTSGIEVFDRRGVRPERKTLTFMIAPTGRGKTWWLIECGKGAWQHHKKILHVTLELSEEKTARRYIQSIFSLTKDEAEQVSIPRFERNEHGHVTAINLYELQRDSILNKRREIFNYLEQSHYPNLLIKEFPPGSLTTEHLYLYLDSLKNENGFEPDEIIVDYVDLMHIDQDSFRIETGQRYVELRGIGVNRNAAMLTASQGNAQSEDAKLVGLKNAAESWAKNGTADNVFTFSQTPEEQRLGLARIYAAKSRDNRDKFIALISQAYAFGQFALDSVVMHPQVLEAIERIGSN